jgi:phosphoserine phosphatase RsbU/P
MSDRPAAFQIGMYISTFFIVVFVLFTYWSFSYNKNLIRKNAESQARLISTRIIGSINEKIVTIQELSSNMAMQIPYLYETDMHKAFVNNIVDKYEYITSINIVLNNSYKSAIQENADMEDKIKDLTRVYGRDCTCPLFNSVVLPMASSDSARWSEPYLCPKDSNLVVLYYLPFQHKSPEENEAYSGYITCEISLDFMNNLILQSKVGEEGFAFLISEDGTFITHPMKQLVLRRNLFELPATVFKGDRSELEKFVHDDFGFITVYPDYLNNTASIAYHMKLPHTGWVLATTIPYRELYRDLYWFIIRMSLILIFIIVAIFSTIFYISNQIMKPLSRVTREIHTFSYDSYGQEQQVQNEAEALAHSLKRLRKTYEKLRLNEAESLVKRQQFQRDLLTASEIQRSMIPAEGNWNLSGNGISLYSVFRPANVVSGDLYDFFMVDDRHLLIAIGDVSGSGVPAALFMGVAHTFIKSFSIDNNAKTIVRKANKVLCQNNSNQFFLTLFLGILNIEDGTLNYCNAGHTPAIVIRRKGTMEILDKPHGLPLGLYSERNYEEATIRLEAGDKIVLYTDGITDQLNNEGKHFGEEQLRNQITRLRNESPEALTKKLMQHLEEFRGNSIESDDLSILVLNYAAAGTSKRRESA